MGEAVASALWKARSVYEDLSSRGEATRRLGRGGFGDVTMMADMMCEEAIISELTRGLGTERVTIVAEESGIKEWRGTPDYVIVVDPIDGSTNLRKGIKCVSTGVAVACGERFKDVMASGVLDLIHGELYLAAEDELRLPSDSRPSDVREVREAVMMVDFRSAKRGSESAAKYLRLISEAKYVRNLGSSLLELVQISVGRIDAYVCITKEMRVFDVVPAMFVLSRLGCPMWSSGLDIGSLPLVTKDRVALIASANRELHDALLDLLELPRAQHRMEGDGGA
ncbi:MAG: inositol monophosphatase family protein [Candidatus Caldarchaeales archaeon]